MVRVDLALVHYPVVNRAGELTAAAVTNLDLHDIARAGRTYGVDTVWIVTPDARQQEIAGRLVAHWTEGYGAAVNPDRKEALSRVRFCADLEETVQAARDKWNTRPTVLATSAALESETVSCPDVRCRLAGGEPMLLLFGTAWGLAPEVLAAADGVLPAIRGTGTFNHLSVRSAVSIILDRLLAPGGER
ncbi:MAG: RNA methyltransferase [Desulfobulbaceae bacterium]